MGEDKTDEKVEDSYVPGTERHGIHALTKAQSANISETDIQEQILPAIRAKPELHKRYKDILQSIRNNPQYKVELFEAQRLAVMILMAEQYENYVFSGDIDRMLKSTKAGEMTRKMSEYALTFLRDSKVEKKADSSLKSAKKIIAKMVEIQFEDEKEENPNERVIEAQVLDEEVPETKSDD